VPSAARSPSCCGHIWPARSRAWENRDGDTVSRIRRQDDLAEQVLLFLHVAKPSAPE
jgi:hypothetical protein